MWLHPRLQVLLGLASRWGGLFCFTQIGPTPFASVLVIPMSPRTHAFITRPSTNLLRGTVIDHALHNSPTIVLSQYDTGPFGLWLGMSDHRPVIAAYSGLRAPGSCPPFNNVFSQALSLKLSHFRPSVMTVKQLRDGTPPGYGWKVRVNLLQKRRLNSGTSRTSPLNLLRLSRNGSSATNTRNIGALPMLPSKPSSWR